MTGLPKILVCLAVIVLSVSVSKADVFFTTKDNSVLGHSSEQNMNLGAASSSRIAKSGHQHTTVCDFDTQAIADFMTNNPLGPGQKYEATMYWFNTGGWTAAGLDVQVGTLNLEQDWAEGDSASFTNFGWSVGTAASVYNYAQGVNLDGTQYDLGTSVQWIEPTENGGYAGNLGNLPIPLVNSVNLHGSDAELNTYVSVVLDDAILTDLVTNAKNRGLRFDALDTTYQNPGTRYREQNGVGNQMPQDPYLEVLVVPEPATMALLGLGLAGLAAIRRRRR